MEFYAPHTSASDVRARRLLFLRDARNDCLARINVAGLTFHQTSGTTFTAARTFTAGGRTDGAPLRQHFIGATGNPCK